MAAWNPWRTLRGRSDIVFHRTRLPEVLGGAVAVRKAEGTVIMVDVALRQEERLAALAHELLHVERGCLPPDAPEHIVAKEERQVEDEAARRLVPFGQLSELCRRAEAIGEQLALWEVARIFGVTEDIAERAVRLWAAEREA